MAGTVIVALPSVDDKVYRISSEKVPHLTLAYLGENVSAEDSATIVTYVQHAASELSPFYMSVDYRGELGPDQADVVFFDKNGWDMERVTDFRHYLMLNDTLKKAYDSVEQFPEWTPHLTLGYPEAPAKEDDSDYPGIHSVSFDRIAIWFGDSEGPEFRLKYNDHAMMDSVMAMSGTSEKGAFAAAFLFNDPSALEQYGKKGMRWGVRKDEAASRGGAATGPTAAVVTQTKPGKFAKVEGGERHPLHEDAVKSLAVRQVAKKSTTDALSNQELKAAVERMQLEQKYSQLEFASDRRSRGQRFLAGFFGQRKELKFKDMDEEGGEKIRSAVESALAARAAAKAAT